MKKHNLAFIDLETTGLDPERHEIIEIGCIIARQVERPGCGPSVEKIEEIDLKVKPEHVETADPQSFRINGYTPEAWLFAVDLKPALEQLAEKTKDAIMVGQNVSFDWVFLEKAFAKTGVVQMMHYHKIDTIALAFAKLYDDGRAQKFSLRSLCELLGVVNEREHSALSDVRATYDVYRKLLNC